MFILINEKKQFGWKLNWLKKEMEMKNLAPLLILFISHGSNLDLGFWKVLSQRNEFCLFWIFFQMKITFDTLINAFEFKVKPLGGTKVKSVCCAKLVEFRNTSAISSILYKTFCFVIFWWKIWQIGFFFHRKICIFLCLSVNFCDCFFHCAKKGEK